METESWPMRLGRELQELGPNSDDLDYYRLEETLSHAVHAIRFVRKCYHKEAVDKRRFGDDRLSQG